MRGHLIIGLLCLVLAGCAYQNKAHRVLGPSADVCADAVTANTEDHKTPNAIPAAHCYFQTTIIPGADAWQELAKSSDSAIREHDRFKLAFVEFDDQGQFRANRNQTKGTPSLGAKQWQTLQTHLGDAQNDYVIVYIHGWRHDAAYGDGDVHKFRRMLAYARGALNTQCVSDQSYCDTRLTGVFLGWRGRSSLEPPKPRIGTTLFGLAALPTVWGRQSVSERLSGVSFDGERAIAGSDMKTVLEELDAKISGQSRLMVVGQSMGGNILARIMRERSINALEDLAPDESGKEFEAPLGDLAVLINAASPAENWHEIQLAERMVDGIMRDENLISLRNDRCFQDRDPNCKDQDKLRAHWSRFPPSQPPVYISLTSTERFNVDPENWKNKSYDLATGLLFPISRIVSGAKNAGEWMTIGHHFPDYLQKDGEAKHYAVLENRAIGVSHEADVLAPTWQNTAFENAGVPAYSACTIAPNWLEELRGPEQPFNPGWDTSDSGSALATGYNQAKFQWAHGLHENGDKNFARQSVASANSPFWNVRATENTIAQHDGWASYPLWCALHQIVLE